MPFPPSRWLIEWKAPLTVKRLNERGYLRRNEIFHTKHDRVSLWYSLSRCLLFRYLFPGNNFGRRKIIFLPERLAASRFYAGGIARSIQPWKMTGSKSQWWSWLLTKGWAVGFSSKTVLSRRRLSFIAVYPSESLIIFLPVAMLSPRFLGKSIRGEHAGGPFVFSRKARPRAELRHFSTNAYPRW